MQGMCTAFFGHLLISVSQPACHNSPTELDWTLNTCINRHAAYCMKSCTHEAVQRKLSKKHPASNSRRNYKLMFNGGFKPEFSTRPRRHIWPLTTTMQTHAACQVQA